jgi:hypothetical protein
MMAPVKATESNSDSSTGRDSAQKIWQQPRLRKLPIAATAGGHLAGDEGNTSKSGSANVVS